MPLSVSSAVRQLSDGNSAGTVLGRSSTDLIAFWNATPVAQPSGNAQAALARGVSGGVISTAATSQSPGQIVSQSSSEVSLSLLVGSAAYTGSTYSLASGDFIFVNKPTTQAGLALASARFSGATAVAVGFSNFTATAITATAGEKYGIVALRGLPFITQTLTPAVVAASTTAEQTFNVTGVRVGEVVQVMPPSLVTNIGIAGVRVPANNQVAITFSNASASTATTPPAGTYTIWSTGGLDSVSNVVQVSASNNTASTSTLTATAVTAASITVTGLATTDSIIGISKPTVQTSLALVQSYVSAANTLAVGYYGSVITTPTSNEAYALTIFRPQPAAPIVTYTQALTPAAVGPNTTTSQAFTVTGLVASSMVWVNKPSFQPGLGIGGARVSATNVLEITYINATAATITPTAAESYVIANFQQPIPDAGNVWSYTLTPQMQANAVLSNAIRSALASSGFIAGA